MTKQEKMKLHESFWLGEGPCLLLIPAPEPDGLPPYRLQVENPSLMWQAQRDRARMVIDWPTDGIPTIRANYGVVFVPALAGLEFSLQGDQMPWPGDPLEESCIRRIPEIDIAKTSMMRRACEVYECYLKSGETEIAAYLADTQGVFDIAHLLYGHDLFTDILEESRQPWAKELLESSLDLYVRATKYVKSFLNEPLNHMIHGHGTPQGVYFPHGGARVSEDTAILLSPESIATWVIPYVERALAQFGGGFAHFCGRHENLFMQLCQCGVVRAIDVQPDVYDPHWLMEQCAATGTVLYSGIAAHPGETWRSYVKRLSQIVKATGARCIIRPGVVPETREECAAMLDLWHEMTS
ncbi:MAG TPA: hypothetical protein PKY35_02675 [Candidatus Hydrogenedentes bacterium]|nr:hypothetical protein [Candidatus Hydrogenedentota bacterium]HOL75906.1 hypothetical protein [Candidatus Hydrogenedentota bacterium]HPO85685.1 hypothetical protein [Candidatus Hydrogenedentota bacterium]